MEPYIAVQQEDVDLDALVRAAKVPGTGVRLTEALSR